MSPRYQLSSGKPQPLGPCPDGSGCNFAIQVPDANSVILCLFHPDTEETIAEIPLEAKTGKVWHGHLTGVWAGQLYGYRIDGENLPYSGRQFDKQKLLIDPYAKQLNRPAIWNARQYEGDSQFMVPKCVVTERTKTFSESHNHPGYELDELIIYEAHVRGLTKLHPEVPEHLQGTYLGVCQPEVIEHLQQLGITAVQFMPVMAFMPEPFISNKKLTNYWGYNPISFFAPDPRYACENPIAEFKTMVRCLHNAGIEVILDVVFNHTAEGGVGGPTLSFRGLDNSAFYLFERNEFGAIDYSRYVNNSGCGNSVNVAFPSVMKLVMDALRYWVQEMGVDGFRFDLAASLGRDPHEFSTLAGFFRTLRQDPVMQDIKLIAEPWDIGHGGYRLGQFPSNWSECNDKYRDTVRAFWRGDKGLTGDFATRLLGSRDVFPKSQRSILSSVNFITYHDGFTLQDLVSYAERHNEANGEQNRDGHSHNLSANYGVEGDTQDNHILSIRERQKRNFFATLMFSQGIPHVLGGDELSRTQQGNNNAYCQDNEINWYQWKLNERKQDFLDFCRYCIQLRKDSKLLRQLSLPDDHYNRGFNVDKVQWYRPDGCRKVEDDWHDYDNQAFAVELKGSSDVHHADHEHWLLMFNASDHEIKFSLPLQESGSQWSLVLDTSLAKISQLQSTRVANMYLLAQKSLCVLRCHAVA